MFDTLCADTKRWRRESRDIPAPPAFEFSAASYGFFYWEEHCVECGQPQCYSVCPLYERGNDWKCKRMEYGFVEWKPQGEGRASYCDCTLKKWAKIEAAYTGAQVSVDFIARWKCADALLVACARVLAKGLSFIPGRIGPATIYRRLRLYAMKAVRSKPPSPAVLVFQCYSAERSPVKLHFTIVERDREVFHHCFDLAFGWNQKLLPLPQIGKGTRLLLFANNEAPFRLVFSKLDVCCGIARGGEPQAAGEGRAEAARSAEHVKCLAWDLDNTLWRGILVEDGAGKLRLNEEAVRVIQALDKRGILHTILSKNDHSEAWQVVTSFGLADYFLCPHINWGPKSDNLRSVAKQLNLGVDAFAFVDDSAFERAEVGENLPMVRVFDDSQIASLLDRPEFNPPLSAESGERRLSYLKEMERKQVESQFASDYVGFLKTCRIKVELFRPREEDDVNRCLELIQRSNQLNLTGKRYSRDEFLDMLRAPECMPVAVRCTDRFGTYGIVAFIALTVRDAHASIREFVMSCRVAKKRCEHAVLCSVVERLAAAGNRDLTADLVRTGRNQPMIDVFNELPFEKTEQGDVRVHYTSEFAASAWQPEGIVEAVFVDDAQANAARAQK